MPILRFPPATIIKLRNLSLSENDIHDVYTNGEIQKNLANGMAVIKKYPSYGYEIGLFYAVDSNTGEIVITHVWKRERR
jgi:hypothetical protein